MSDTPPSAGEPRRSPRSAATEQRLSGRAQRRIAQEEAAKRQRLLAIAGGVVAVAVVALLVFVVFVRRPAAPAVQIAAAPDAALPVAGRTMGNPDAPVTVLEWGDYT
jgi:hypothetical protein